MKKNLTISTVAVSLLTAHAALAEEPVGPTIWDGFSGFMSPDWDRDLSVTLGTKVWLNEWSRERALNFSQGITITVNENTADEKTGFLFASDTAPDASESDIEAVPIPQLSMRYKWLVVNGGYYSKTHFDFGASAGFFELLDVNSGEVLQELAFTDFETSGERYEWDASAGIYVHPYVAILGGYKKVRQEIVTTISFTDNTNVFNSFEGREVTDIAIEGPTIGIAASVPIGGGFGIYGSYAHGFMDTDSRSVDDEGKVFEQFRDLNTTYNVAEGGFSYTHGVEHLMPHMPLSAATAYAGYRYQRISTEFGVPANPDAGDVTEGFAVGVNLTF
ncbi:MAG: hypothetical protein ACREF9_14870 [Opitutaceae bacterium]